jgi:hypothetical protein
MDLPGQCSLNPFIASFARTSHGELNLSLTNFVRPFSINSFMKPIIGLLLFFLVQSADAQKPVFFRVYNSNGKKLNKGILFQLSDTSVTLTRRNRFVETPVSQIDVIKSKRTTGHRVLKTALVVVGSAGFLVAAIYASNHTSPRNGYINSGANKSNPGDLKSPLHKTPRPQKKYRINRDAEKWQEQRKLLVEQII